MAISPLHGSRPKRSIRSSRAFRLLALLAAALAAAVPSRAGCGLSFCPRPEEPGERNLDLGFMAKRTGFNVSGVEGSYTELMASVQYTALGHLAVGLHAPFILLEATDTEAGLGNFIAYGEWRMRPAFLAALAAGAQLEIPMGGAEHGLGDDHWMAVPYVTAARHAGPLMLGGAIGTSFSVYGAHEEGHHHPGMGPMPVYVHPHEHSEFLYRISAGTSLLGGDFLPEAFLDGQQVIGDTEVDGAGTAFLNVGLTLPWRIGDFQVIPNASYPVLSRDRFLWNAGITLGWKIGLGRSAPATGET